MRALKAIVIGMGALIALAVVLLAYGLYKKSVDPTWKLFGPIHPVSTSANSTPPKAVGDIQLGLPAGCEIVDIRPDGRRAYVLTRSERDCPAIIIIDSVDGRVLGNIRPQ